MPTWPGAAGVPSEPGKNNRSPGWAAATLATGVPTWACSCDVRGRLIPMSLNTFWTNPEQSSPVAGLVPPHWYGIPRYFCASATTAEPRSSGVPEAFTLLGADSRPVRVTGAPVVGREAAVFPALVLDWALVPAGGPDAIIGLPSAANWPGVRTCPSSKGQPKRPERSVPEGSVAEGTPLAPPVLALPVLPPPVLPPVLPPPVLPVPVLGAPGVATCCMTASKPSAPGR